MNCGLCIRGREKRRVAARASGTVILSTRKIGKPTLTPICVQPARACERCGSRGRSPDVFSDTACFAGMHGVVDGDRRMRFTAWHWLPSSSKTGPRTARDGVPFETNLSCYNLALCPNDLSLQPPTRKKDEKWHLQRQLMQMASPRGISIQRSVQKAGVRTRQRAECHCREWNC